MITTIINLIIQLLNFIISFILTLVFSAFPDWSFENFNLIYSTFFNIIRKGLNLLYFCSGEMVWIFGDIVIALFTAKHIVLPIINFTRKIIIK